jgi:hypothetical protein
MFSPRGKRNGVRPLSGRGADAAADSIGVEIWSELYYVATEIAKKFWTGNIEASRRAAAA